MVQSALAQSQPLNFVKRSRNELRTFFADAVATQVKLGKLQVKKITDYKLAKK